MITETSVKICNSILEKLQQSGIETKKIGFQDLLDRKIGAISRPVVNISIPSATFKKITFNTYKCIINPSLLLIIQDLRGEEERRFKILALIESIIDVLQLNDFDLDMQDPIIVQGFNDVTDEKFANAGYIIYEIKFTTSFNYTSSIETDEGLITSIVSKYFINNPDDDGVLDLETTLKLNGIYGGNARSSYKLNPIYGGKANSVFKSSIYGGNAYKPS